MKRFLLAALLVLATSVIASPALAQNTPANPGINKIDPDLMFNLTRPCFLQPGPWTLIACTGPGVAAASAQLNPGTSYWLYCPQASAIRTGTSSAQATPTTSDGVFGAGSMVRLPTDSTILFFGCLPQAAQAGCFIQECR